SPSKPSAAFSFSKSASFCAALPCISRMSVAATLLRFGSFPFFSIVIPQRNQSNLPTLLAALCSLYRRLIDQDLQSFSERLPPIPTSLGYPVHFCTGCKFEVGTASVFDFQSPGHMSTAELAKSRTSHRYRACSIPEGRLQFPGASLDLLHRKPSPTTVQ